MAVKRIVAETTFGRPGDQGVLVLRAKQGRPGCFMLESDGSVLVIYAREDGTIMGGLGTQQELEQWALQTNVVVGNF